MVTEQHVALDGPVDLPVQRISASLWITFTICLLSNIFAGIVSTLLAVYLPVVVNDVAGSLSADQFSRMSAVVSACYVLGWATGGLTWGYITDRIGRARSLVIAVAGYSIFTALIGVSFSWDVVVLLRFAAGFAVGGLMVITPTLLSEVWPASSRSIVLGIDSIGFPIGIFSSGVVTYFVADWRQAFLFAVVPFAMALIAIGFVKESKNWQAAVRKTTGDAPVLRREDKNNIVKGAIVFGSMLIGLWALFSWIPTWVQGILPATAGQSERGLTMMVLGAGGLLGGFSSGWIANIGVRKAMVICFGGCFILSLILFGTNSEFSPLVYAETALLALFFGMSQGLLSIYIPQLFPFAVRARSTGICFNAGRFVTAGAVFFVGSLVTLFGGLSNALLSFSAVFLAGGITLLFSSEISTLKGSGNGTH